jgi:hypothetical protein
LAIIAIITVGLIGLFGLAFATRFVWRGGFFARPLYRDSVFMKGGMRGWGGMGGGTGQISKIEGNAITIQRPNGQSYTLTLKEDTVINKSVKGSKDDLKVGENIMVFGNGMFGPQTIWIGP